MSHSKETRRAYSADDVELQNFTTTDGNYPAPRQISIPEGLTKSRCVYGVSQMTYLIGLGLVCLTAIFSLYITKDSKPFEKLVQYITSQNYTCPT